MKYFFLLLLFPFVGLAQPVSQRIGSAEAELAQLRKKEDSMLLKIEDLKFEKIHEDLGKNGLPALAPGDEVIYHKAYAFVYAEPFEQAKWVAHIILPDVVSGNEGRSNDFRPDPAVKTGSAVEADYFLRIYQPDSSFKYDAFGYDRGHLAPSADFRYSKRALSESFMYSNMSPQVAELNRGRWAELEDLVRQYVIRNRTQVYVVSGGVLKPGLKKIERGINHVSIPEKYFKVVLDLTNQRAIGFILPNANCPYPVMSYACSVDSVEAVAGLDFFPALPDDQEARLEKGFDPSKWLGEKELSDVLPLRADSLPRNTFNTTQAQQYMGKNETVRVCGTVVSTKLSSKGNIFINLDKRFPNAVFSISIFKDYTANFSYQPDQFLVGKTICVTGKITNYNGTPSMSVTNESAIEIIHSGD